MRDLVSLVAETVVTFPAVNTTTPTPTVIDMGGANPATTLMFVVQVGAGGITFTGTNKLEIVVEDSDDNSTFTAVTTGNVRTSVGASATLTSGVLESYIVAKAAVSTNAYGYIGGKRYVKVTPTFGGTHATGTIVGVIAVKGGLALRAA